MNHQVNFYALRKHRGPLHYAILQRCGRSPEQIDSFEHLSLLLPLSQVSFQHISKGCDTQSHCSDISRLSTEITNNYNRTRQRNQKQERTHKANIKFNLQKCTTCSNDSYNHLIYTVNFQTTIISNHRIIATVLLTIYERQLEQMNCANVVHICGGSSLSHITSFGYI